MATPRTDRLWHPARGISFSPGPASPASLARRSHTLAEVSISTTSHSHAAATGQSTSAQSEEVWAAEVVQQVTLPNPGLPAPMQQVEDEYISVQADVEEAEKKSTDAPPPPVLEYRMVDDLFYEAKGSPRGSPKSFWSYSQYRRTAEDGSLHPVKVHYCRSTHTMERVCKQYFMGEKVLGFDLEWMVDATKYDGPKRNVSLIQLASPSRIGLFHVAMFADKEDMVGPSFRSLMEDPDVAKVGVSIKGDTTRLRNFLGVQSRGLVELSNLYRLVTYCRNRQYHNINKKLVPLATQVEEYLHLPLFKGQDVRSSNWSKALTMAQVIYSASDAYAGLHLHATLEHHRKQLDPCQPSPHCIELNLPIQFVKVPDAAGLDDSLEAVGVAPEAGQNPEWAKNNPALTIETASSPAAKTKTKLRLTGSTTPLAPTSKTPGRPKYPRIQVAEDWVASYRASHPQSRLTPAPLRAYYLWHDCDLSPAAIARLIRDPPLQTITVVKYILAVVQSENLPADLNRLREAADFIPQDTLRTRWPVVAAMVATD